MKIAVATVCSPGYKELGDITEPSKIAYCERWGYSWQPFKPQQNPERLARGEVTESSPPDVHYDAGGYVRYEHTERLLGQFDVVLQVGADALIMNHAVSIEGLLLTYGGGTSFMDSYMPGVYISDDTNFVNDENILWAHRENDDGEDLVRQLAWQMTRKPGGAQFEHQAHPCGWKHPYGCQMALRDYLFLHPSYRTLAHFLPQRVLDANLNSHYGFPSYVQGQYRPGDFILHLPGMPWPDRTRYAREYAQKVTN